MKLINQYISKGGERIEIILSIRKAASKYKIPLENSNCNKRSGDQYVGGKNLRFYFPASLKRGKLFNSFVREIEKEHNLFCQIFEWSPLSHSIDFTR